MEGVKAMNTLLRKREIIYLTLHCHHQNDSCIKMSSDESRFTVSLTVRGKDLTQNKARGARADRISPQELFAAGKT